MVDFKHLEFDRQHGNFHHQFVILTVKNAAYWLQHGQNTLMMFEQF
jgi:hypothetical protein